MLGCILLGALFLISGLLHFSLPEMYARIVPPWLPAHRVMVAISGAAEIAGGVGVLIPATRHLAAWGLVVLLVAIWPANLYMATAHIRAPGIMGQSWAQWLRVPLQIPLIYWAFIYTRR